MGIDLWFRTNISAPRPPILKVKVLNFPSIWGMCLNAKKSGFPVQPDEKIRKNRVFWSTYRESCYHTFDNSVVRHIPHFFQPHARTYSRFQTQALKFPRTAGVFVLKTTSFLKQTNTRNNTRVSKRFIMEPQTAQEQSALEGDLSLKSRFSCHPDKYVMTGNKCTTFKSKLSCC